MIVNSQESGQHDMLPAMSIHINTLRLLVACLLPMAAKNADEPELWLKEVQALALQSADYAAFPQAGAIGSDLMKAAVISSLEEIFSGAKRSLEITLS